MGCQPTNGSVHSVALETGCTTCCLGDRPYLLPWRQAVQLSCICLMQSVNKVVFVSRRDREALGPPLRPRLGPVWGGRRGVCPGQPGV